MSLNRKPIPAGQVIGLSLYCIRDVAATTVGIDRVIKVYSEERVDDLEEIIRLYKRIGWGKSYLPEGVTPEDCEKVFRELFTSRKIIFPPRRNQSHVPMIDEGLWVSDEKEIRWADEVHRTESDPTT